MYLIDLIHSSGFKCNLYAIDYENLGFPSGSDWKRQWHPTPVLLPGKSHRRRSLVSCSPWGHEESDMTEQLHFHFSLSCIGGGNGNPLQHSCLENPGDDGAVYGILHMAAVYGVAQSRTRLKRLSSSSSSSSGSDSKDSAWNAGDQCSDPGSGRNPEKGTHSSIIAWEIPWREEPGGLQHMGSQKVRRDWVTNTFTLLHDILPQVKVSSEFQICIHKYFILLYGSLKIANIMYLDSQALA